MSELIAQFREWRDALQRRLPPWSGRAAAVALIIAGALLPLLCTSSQKSVTACGVTV